ncbi:hypothetical protein [Rathayibacter iranicus]|uniref:Uncharacterized protein n=1 Tax=Rathayibacter iranicus NCPPB 2253 = VKM Ac-1602 TaxID=1328868 RepID=A0ABX5LK06_9MICO|nr:hypothetical protein [Rathayibacter iranicus]MWV30186.1 hypothetical protein [Rathayibacter iranicus NCPPB 2253 = VKM Ac-1602]PWJ65374.1 hypothetical protein B0H03_103222 [Rathayibacter iranicus NCPPB 2253 = VKM Ac-1602]
MKVSLAAPTDPTYDFDRGTRFRVRHAVPSATNWLVDDYDIVEVKDVLEVIAWAKRELRDGQFAVYVVTQSIAEGPQGFFDETHFTRIFGDLFDEDEGAGVSSVEIHED